MSREEQRAHARRRRVQWNLSNPDTIGTISKCPLYEGVLISGHANAAFGTKVSVLSIEVS